MCIQIHNSRHCIKWHKLQIIVLFKRADAVFISNEPRMPAHSSTVPLLSRFFLFADFFSVSFSSSSYLLCVCERWLLPECPHTPFLGGPWTAEDCEPETGQSRRGDGACCDVTNWRYMLRMLVWYTLLSTEVFAFPPEIIYLVQKGFPAFLHPCPAHIMFTFFFSTFVLEERRLLQRSDCVYSESLTPQGKLVACRRDVTEILVCTVNQHSSSHIPLLKCIDLGATPISLMIILAFAGFDIFVIFLSIIWLHQAWN